jgi:plasmid maintenance system antidote protein VapI
MPVIRRINRVVAAVHGVAGNPENCQPAMNRTQRDRTLCAAIGSMIRAARLEAGLTQQTLGISIGCDSHSAKALVSRAEHGRQRFTVETVYRYAVALGVDPKELLP